MSEKRLRIDAKLSKRDPAYWRQRLFKNAYTYKGKPTEVSSWSVKIQLFGKRKSFTLDSHDQAQAAGEACQIYQTIIDQGWDHVTPSRGGRDASLGSPPSPVRYDTEYWKQRLIHRRYPEPSPSQSQLPREFSVWIDHARAGQYFPLATSDESEAATRAMNIYRRVIDKGWPAANSSFPRELSVAFRWQDNPLAWSYTTLHTRLERGPSKPIPDVARAVEQRVVFIEPDAGIRFALASCANSSEGFRCDATFAGAAEALREIPRGRVDLAFANHDLPEGADVAGLEELQRVRPDLTVLAYSVFEDTDQLFKSTPGGAMVYMLKRTSPARIFEPIEHMAGHATREQIASHVRSYFQQLAALLPSGPPSWKLAKLTPREHEVLAFLSKGDLVKEIADTLGISKWTVQSHVKSVFEKLKVHTRTEAVITYLRK